MFNSKVFNLENVRLVTLSQHYRWRLFAALCVLPACSINANDKSADGEKHVDIKSPIGDLHVSEQADIRDAGLTLYPGAKPAPKDDGDDKKSANVNLSISGIFLESGGGGVHLR